MTFAHCTLAGFHTGANRPVHKINKTLTPSTLMIKLGHRLAKRDEMVIKARFSLVAVTTVLVTACAAFLTQDSRWVSRAMQQPSVKYDSHGRVSSPPTLVKIAEENWLEATLTLMIQFGLRDEQPRQWNGKLTVRGARIIRVRPWHFGADMTLSSETNTWTCSSWQGPRANAGSHTAHLPAIPRTSVRPGIQVDLTAPDVGSASLAVTTTQGDFSVRLSRLLAEGTVFLLDGGVSVSRALSSFPVAVGSQPQAEAPGGPVWHDYPSISITPGKSDEVWLCYVTYSRDHNADRIVARRLRQGRQLDQEQVVSPWGDHFGTALEHDSGGVLWAVYSAQVNGNWDLYGRSFRDRSWSTPLRLSHSPQPDLHHRLARAADGSIWLVWQGFRNGQSDILARRWDGARWGPVIQVSEKDNTGSPSNDWEPAVTPHPQGGVAVVWDRYVDGQYDLFYRLMSDRFPGTVTRATSSPEFEARPSIGVDSMRRLWIAFDRAGPDWGKDTGFWLEKAQKREGSRLVGGKGIGLVMIAPGSKRSPQPTPEVSLQLGPNELIASPKVIVDSKGKLWLFFRRQINLNMNGRGVVFKFLVESYGSRFDADSGQWTEPRLVADSSGRLDIFPDLAVTDDRLWATWATDHRAMVGRRPDISSVFAGSVSLDEISTPPRYAVASAKTEASLHAKRQPFHPNEAEDVARIRSYRIRAGSREYGIYRGDLHRHTENSNDGGGDGSLADAYRYALDAASLDFLMISDHNDGGRIYDWWRREKSNDLFRIGNSFVGLYGYERSAPYPNGHRNVLLPRRGIRPLYLSPGERGFLNQQKVLRTGDVLYPYLRENEGITFAHTSATTTGTDWGDHDPELEPSVEIFQGDRNSYEAVGAPWAADPEDRSTQESGFRPDGFVNLALAKGYKLGFQASSDHLSTHLSYACIVATENTPAALLDAMRRRHTYGATDNIIMDVRSDGVDASRIMGDVFRSPGNPNLHVRVIGTGKLDRVVVVKDSVVVYSTRPDGPETEFTFTDLEARPGQESYYYIRALQNDGMLAWSSPMWITPR